MPFVPPNQQRQSTGGKKEEKNKTRKKTNQLEEVTSIQTSAMVSVATTAI